MRGISRGFIRKPLPRSQTTRCNLLLKKVSVMAKILFILSSERSGSTLLSAMLGMHAQVVAPPELWLLRFRTFDHWLREKPQAMFSLREAHALAGLREADIAGYSGKDSLEVYTALLGRLPADAILVDKTPGYANDRAVLEHSLGLSAFDPHYIWLIRHPLGVVDATMSLLRGEPAYQGMPGALRRARDSAQALLGGGLCAKARKREDKWALQNLNLRDFLARVPAQRQHTVLFENLLLDQRAAMLRLCGFLGLEFGEAMLDPFQNAPRAPLPRGLGDPRFHTRTRIETAPAMAWQARYREGSLRIETRRLMAGLGVFAPGQERAPSAQPCGEPAHQSV